MANPIEKAITQGKLRLERARSHYGLVDVVVRVFKRFSETDGGSYSAALTYYMFFSIFPLLIVGTAALGFVTQGDPELQRDLYERGRQAFPMIEDALSPEGFAAIERARQELAVTGLLLALYTGSGAIVALEHALNKVQRIDDEPNFLEKRLRSLKWLAILGLGTLLSVAVSMAATWTGQTIGGFAGGAAATLLRVVAGFVGLGIFATAYKFLPVKEQSWAEVLPGAAVASVAFEILKYAGSLFIAGGEESRNATFGAFAAAATLLVVSFLLARVTLLAAEVNAVLAERRFIRQPAATEEGGDT